MRTVTVDGAIYGDLDLGGNYVSLIDGKEVNVNGAIHKQLPSHVIGAFENVLYTRWGDGIIGGQGGISGNAWIDKGAGWKNLGLTFGTSPIAFTDTKLYIVRNSTTIDVYLYRPEITLLLTLKQQVGVQGLRYIDRFGIPITGDATYDGSHLPDVNLAEYTKLYDLYFPLVIGQSYIDGCVAVVEGMRKLVEPGNCRFIRAYYNGVTIAVAISKLSERRMIFKWFTLNELLDFPNELTPHPNPDPIPEPTNMKLPNAVKATRDVFIKKFSFPTVPQGEPVPVEFDVIFRNYMRKMVEQIVFSNPNQGWGWKSADETRPPSKDSIANNKLVEGDLLNWDMFGGVGTGRPTLNVDPDSTSIKGQHFIEVTGINHLELPGPLPIPNPVDNSDLIKNLQRRLTELEGSALTSGSKITLRNSESGFYMCAEQQGAPENDVAPSVREKGNVNCTRKGVGSFETFTIEKQ